MQVCRTDPHWRGCPLAQRVVRRQTVTMSQGNPVEASSQMRSVQAWSPAARRAPRRQLRARRRQLLTPLAAHR